jgi:hypothetical protein
MTGGVLTNLRIRRITPMTTPNASGGCSSPDDDTVKLLPRKKAKKSSAQRSRTQFDDKVEELLKTPDESTGDEELKARVITLESTRCDEEELKARVITLWKKDLTDAEMLAELQLDGLVISRSTLRRRMVLWNINKRHDPDAGEKLVETLKMELQSPNGIGG